MRHGRILLEDAHTKMRNSYDKGSNRTKGQKPDLVSYWNVGKGLSNANITEKNPNGRSIEKLSYPIGICTAQHSPI